MSVHNLQKYLLPSVLVFAVFSLIWRQGNIIAGIPKPFEILIFLAFALFLVELFTSELARSIAGRLEPVFTLYALIFITLLSFSVLGSLASDVLFPEWDTYGADVFFEYTRIIFVFALFFLTVYVVARYRWSARLILGAIAASPLVLYVAFFVRWQEFFVLNGRLIGARNDPNYLATFIALGIIVAVVYFLYNRSGFRWVGLGYTALISPLFLWTGSRSAFLSLFIVLLVLVSADFLRQRSGRRVRDALLVFTVLSLAISASFLVLPERSKDLLYERVVTPVLSDSAAENIFLLSGVVVDDEIKSDDFELSRGNAWSTGALMAIRSPLGFGPAYHNWNPVGAIGRPHNLFLEAILTTGWMGFLVWVAALALILKDARRISRGSDFVGAALATGFLYLLINGMFLDMFTLRWLWLIMGMIVGYAFLKNNEDTNSISNPADV